MVVGARPPSRLGVEPQGSRGQGVVCLFEAEYRGSFGETLASDRMGEAVERLYWLFDIGSASQETATAALANHHPGLFEAADRFADRLAAHAVVANHLLVGGEAFGELVARDARAQVIFELGPEREGAASVEHG